MQRQLRYQYCAANKLQVSFSRCSNAVKNAVFRSFCTPMHALQLWCKFRKSCMQIDCMWPINLDGELYTTCLGERVLVATRFNVTYQPLRLCYKKTCRPAWFSKGAENLTTCFQSIEEIMNIFIRSSRDPMEKRQTWGGDPRLKTIALDERLQTTACEPSNPWSHFIWPTKLVCQ